MSESVIHGFIASSAAIAVCHPADTLSRQLQVSSREKFNSSHLVRQGWRGLYRGIGPALITQPSYWAFCLPTYNKMKELSKDSLFYQNHKLFADMVIGFSAGAVATVITNPLWVIRQRMQTEIIKGRTNIGYSKLIQELYRENGMLTFLRGTNITLVKNIQMALLLPVFERIRDLEGWNTYQIPAPVASGISGALAKIISSSGVYPLDVLRTNQRVQPGKKVSIRSVAHELVFERPGGIKNLFRGVGWYWISSAGTFAIMMSLHSILQNKV